MPLVSPEEQARLQEKANRIIRKLTAVHKRHEANVATFNALKLSMDQGVSTPYFIERLRNLLDRMTDDTQAYRRNYEDFYTATGDDSLDNQEHEVARSMITIEQSILAYMAQYVPQEKVAVNPNQNQGDDNNGRNAAVFKPFTLMHDTPMSEYRQWCVRYHTYFNAMKMAGKAAEAQQSLLMSCLDATLGDIVMNSTATCTYADDARETWLSVVDKFFIATYPMHSRITKLVTLQPTPGQTTSGFFREFNRLAKDASAFTCDVNTLITNIMITKCPDPVLRKELLRRPIDYDQAMLLGMESDAAEVAHSATNPPLSVSASAVSKAPSGPRKQGQGPQQSKTRCFRCDRGSHPADKCFTLKKPCPACNKLGHSLNKCTNKTSAKPAASRSAAAPGSSSMITDRSGSQATPQIHL